MKIAIVSDTHNNWANFKKAIDWIKKENISLKIYDVLGNEVINVYTGMAKPGTYNAEINGTLLPSGVYFYTLKSDNFVETKKMLLIK